MTFDVNVRAASSGLQIQQIKPCPHNNMIQMDGINVYEAMVNILISIVHLNPNLLPGLVGGHCQILVPTGQEKCIMALLPTVS